MNSSVIDVVGLGKQYTVKARPIRAHQAIDQTIRGFFRRPGREEMEAFWAVKDCSFNVDEGEVVAILGQNGAGKSVLLKMLAGVIKPTTGEACIRGRMVAMLELGSGFHLEMTGRENVFFNGAILGMRRAEMSRKLQAIVDFSEIGDFLDRPVKHYSTGMYMRLAFSVAAHVDADVLLIDEVLATGDAAFQEKCMERMRRVAAQGATILLVSHSPSQLTDLCTRGMYMSNGELLFDGTLEEASCLYGNSSSAESLDDCRRNAALIESSRT